MEWIRVLKKRVPSGIGLQLVRIVHILGRSGREWQQLAVFAVAWIVADISLGEGPPHCYESRTPVSLVLETGLRSLQVIVPALIVVIGAHILYKESNRPLNGLRNVVLLGLFGTFPSSYLSLILSPGVGRDLASAFEYVCLCGMGFIIAVLAFVWPLVVADVVAARFPQRRETMAVLRIGLVALAGVIWALVVGTLNAVAYCIGY